METKDRIKIIMEDQKMTQQEFADFLQQSPATLSSIFNGRTRPTLNVVDAIKAKIPDISIEWLLYGVGEMRITHPEEVSDGILDGKSQNGDLMLNFDAPNPVPVHQNGAQFSSQTSSHPQGFKTTHSEKGFEEVRIIEKNPRRVTEIRVYYDDQTYETFVPSKK
jgi:transcriptional regulator with XRE-family HTH domain